MIEDKLEASLQNEMMYGKDFEREIVEGQIREAIVELRALRKEILCLRSSLICSMRSSPI